MNDLSRREALVIAGTCACCAMTADLSFAEDAPGAAKVKSLEVGKLADYPKAGFYDKFAKPNKVMVAKLDDRLIVMTATCTHKGCTVKINPDETAALKCPCHKAEFSAQGTPTAGPARTALVRYAVSEKEGVIIADLTKTFIESKWDDAAAFIPLKPADAKAPKPA